MDDDTTPAVLEAIAEATRGKKSKRDEKPSAPIESDFAIPLFPDHDKHAAHVIAHLDVYKSTAPNDGYRGQFPPSSTLLHIGQTCGDGVYEIHAVSGDGVVLRRRPNVKIAVNANAPAIRPVVAPPQGHAPADLTLLTFQREAHEKDSDRVATFARESTEQSREMTKHHLEVLERSTKAQSDREQSFFGGLLAQTQTFMTAMLGANRESFQQQLLMTRETFAQMAALSEQSHQRAIAASDPSAMIALFMQGMQVSRDIAPTDDPLTAITSAGVAGLKEIKGMMALKALGEGKISAGAVAPKKLSAPVSSAQSRANPPTLPATQAPAPAPELGVKLIQLKAMLDKKGLEPGAFLDDILAQLEELPTEAPEDESAESAEPEGGEASTQE